MMSVRAAFFSLALPTCPIIPRRVERIRKGLGTENWCIDADQGSFFLKAYPPQWNRAHEREVLSLAIQARIAGFVPPSVIASLDGDCLCEDGEWAYALLAYVADAAPEWR